MFVMSGYEDTDSDSINQRKAASGEGRNALFGFRHVDLCERCFHGE